MSASVFYVEPPTTEVTMGHQPHSLTDARSHYDNVRTMDEKRVLANLFGSQLWRFADTIDQVR